MTDKPRLAIVTQSYRNDLKECELLCESIDRFVSTDIKHFIFVNDEDMDIFRRSKISNSHELRKKSEILPRGLVRCPVELLHHHYHISFYTIPVREWIVQQICKLGIFDAIGNEYDAVMNIDSETVFMRTFNIENVCVRNNGCNYLFFREIYQHEPCHKEYCNTGKKLLNLHEPVEMLAKHCYMSHPVIFERHNLQQMLEDIASGNLFKSWKIRLCNTYRFSEYYLYGLYCDKRLNMRNHYVIDKHLFPLLNMGDLSTAKGLQKRIDEYMKDKDLFGVWLQKHWRGDVSQKRLSFMEISNAVHASWDRICSN